MDTGPRLGGGPVAGKRASMRKVLEVVRLHAEMGWGQRQIARSVALSSSTVHDYLLRFAAAGLSWPLPAGWGEAELSAALHPWRAAATRPPGREPPDFARVSAELRASKHTTLQLLWEEYREANPTGYTYSRFCHLFRRWLERGELVLRQNHRPGGKAFTDWAGATIPVFDPVSGAAAPASIFVAVLGASSCTFAEAFPNQSLTGAFTAWPTSTPRCASCWRSSTTAPSRSGRARAPACSRSSTGRRCGPCRPSRSSWRNGSTPRSTSTTTSSSTAPFTACPTRWRGSR